MKYQATDQELSGRNAPASVILVPQKRPLNILWSPGSRAHACDKLASAVTPNRRFQDLWDLSSILTTFTGTIEVCGETLFEDPRASTMLSWSASNYE